MDPNAVPPEQQMLEQLERLRHIRMPFGRYGPEKYPPRGIPVIDVPVEYLSWFADREFPSGELGWAMRLVHQAKLDGVDDIFKELRRRNGGWTKL